MLRLFVFLLPMVTTIGWSTQASTVNNLMENSTVIESNNLSSFSVVPSLAPADVSALPSTNVTVPGSISATITIILPQNTSEASFLLLDAYIQFTLSNTTGIGIETISIIHNRNIISKRRYDSSIQIIRTKKGKISIMNPFYRRPTEAPTLKLPSDSPVISGSPVYGWRVPTPAPQSEGTPTSAPVSSISDTPSESPSDSPVESPSSYPSINGTFTCFPLKH